MNIINQEDIPDDLDPGDYCCQIDEISTLADLRIRVIVPLRKHAPGDCLIHITKHPYRYVPAQEEMAGASKWLSTPQGHAWLNDQCSQNNLGLSHQPWICIKIPEEHEMVWFPPIYRTKEDERGMADIVNQGKRGFLPGARDGWLDVEYLREKVDEFYSNLVPVQEDCLV